MNDYLHKFASSQVIQRLGDMGYFDAPASLNHHSPEKGGLYAHSVIVTRILLDLTEKLELKWSRLNSPYVIGMLHDLCKCDDYIPGEGGKWVRNPESLYPGHGEKSLILAQRVFPGLTDEEAACIRWHMGAFDKEENWEYYTRACKRWPNLLYVHTADMLASQIMEV